MKFKPSELLITCDIDGTLVEAPAPVPKRNIEAVRRFIQKGGKFAIASGRSIKSVQPYAELLAVNAPCIVYNGGGVYDYTAKKLLHSVFLPDGFRTYLNTIIAEFPHIGITVVNQSDSYSVSDFHYTGVYLGKEGLSYISSTPDELEGTFFKAIMSMPAELLFRVQAFALGQNWKDVVFFPSSPNLFEMLPRNVNKGTALPVVAQACGLPLSQTISIGDYFNDYEMLKTAGFAATVADAPDEIKPICHLVVGRCMDGALADLIEYIEDRA